MAERKLWPGPSSVVMHFCRDPRSLLKIWPHAATSAYERKLTVMNKPDLSVIWWDMQTNPPSKITAFRSIKWQCCQAQKHAQLIAALPALPAVWTASELWIEVSEERKRVDQSPWKHCWPAQSCLLPSPASHFSPPLFLVLWKMLKSKELTTLM